MSTVIATFYIQGQKKQSTYLSSINYNQYKVDYCVDVEISGRKTITQFQLILSLDSVEQNLAYSVIINLLHTNTLELISAHRFLIETVSRYIIFAIKQRL